MARGIKLQRSAISQVNHFYLRGFRIRIDVSEVCGGMDPYVFLYRRAPANPFNGEQFDEFQCVASFPDMEEYPVGAPSEETPFPYFRLDYIELDVRSVSDFDYVWTTILSEVGRLVETLEKADNLTVEETTVVGEDCFPVEQASESASTASESI